MRLLIIGSLNGQVTEAARIAMTRGAKVAHCENVERGLSALRAGQGADLVMIDVQYDVRALVEALKAERFHVPVVACGVGTDAASAVRAIKDGAKEYIPLPPDAELIAAVLAAVTEESSAIIFRDPSMTAVLRLADQVAGSDASILISGESGTGKELMARHIHAKSRRAAQAFVSVNCAAIPENLLESELFGHEKGAFTGAVARRIGKFEEADGGTLLLDEISEMDPRLQAKLLRAIQERVIDRVGGTTPIKVDIRLIATTNRDLVGEVRAGRFREDLYFRLNVVSLQLPPLRERPKDIDLLANHFVRKYADANGVRQLPLSPAALDVIRAHPWHGNVRELENTMHRAVLLSNGDAIGPEAITLSGSTRESAVAPDTSASANPAGVAVARAALVGRTVADVERDLIIDTLHHCLGNRTHAANILGISIRTLRNKLKLYSEQGAAVPAPGEGERAAV
ncbi:MAG: sigma-54-dependent Fis family transcriptional regulator [Alphaproteobacteria bacterium]|nr:sigma-54-dependent Fis family transcriptional regulator [Alphaproteobacteria bacterium]